LILRSLPRSCAILKGARVQLAARLPAVALLPQAGPVRVKICGITNAADALVAVAAGADALGFVFVPGTKRAVVAGDVRVIASPLPPFVARVGLFVNTSADEIAETIAEAQLDTIQLHGEESPEFAAAFMGRVRVLKAFRIRDAASLDLVPSYFAACHAVLLDAFDSAGHGGTGARFDWSLAERIRALPKPVIIAGGLRPDNVADAVERFAPFAVDVSSGVEASPGRKDAVKVREFVRIAREAA